MRLLIANWSSRQVGGAEAYLDTVIAPLVARGHDVALIAELDGPSDRAPIGVPSQADQWSMSGLGGPEAMRTVRYWAPQLVFVHDLLDPDLEAALLEVAPAVLFAHGYHGTCVSGAKTFKNVAVRPCTRRFGWPCLLHYFPHRCGGWSPLTMMREYERQSRRHDLLSRYAAIVTTSEHMRQEFLRHDVPAPRIHKVVHCIRPEPRATAAWREPPRDRDAEGFRLLFVGRMDRLKGGRTLLDALPLVAQALRKPIHLTLVGDGPDRERWERRAARVCAGADQLRVEFAGWLTGDDVDRTFAAADLLVVPSLWPEPFGLVGPEAGQWGVPAAAFAVGGIPEWLEEGVNGFLAPGTPPTAPGLAEAIAKCLRDPDAHARLRRGAKNAARRFSIARHIQELEAVLRAVTGPHAPVDSGSRSDDRGLR